MPKWKSGERKFAVSLGYAGKKGYWCTIPMPIVKLLGHPTRVVFVVNPNQEIEFRPESEMDKIEALNDKK